MKGRGLALLHLVDVFISVVAFAIILLVSKLQLTQAVSQQSKPQPYQDMRLVCFIEPRDGFTLFSAQSRADLKPVPFENLSAFIKSNISAASLSARVVLIAEIGQNACRDDVLKLQATNSLTQQQAQSLTHPPLIVDLIPVTAETLRSAVEGDGL